MRLTLALGILALAAGCAAAAGKADDVTMTTLARGSYATSQGDRTAVLATTDAEYRRLWSSLIGGGEIPAADFDAGVVVFLLGGQRNTGGWSVEPKSVAMEGDTAVVTAEVKGPPPGSITTQALTYPYAVVSINSRDVKNVRWPQ
jgi:PrcB C-terminal